MVNKSLTDLPPGEVAAPQILHRSLAESPLQQSTARAYLLGVTSEKEGTTMNTERIAKAYRTWRKYNKAYNELARLSDRDLDDIGIRRGDISGIARAYALQ
jgi:uncharacterized protein YjiS (DUF1127 family)